VIKVNCAGCSKELEEPGALIFSPPTYPVGDCEKFHICASCWDGVRKVITTGDYTVEW
jgi:hypothetical protein